MRWAVWLVLASASCWDAPFEGYVSHSQFFEYHDQVKEPLCPTLLARLDAHAEMIGGKIGLSLDSNNPYRYYKFRDAAAFASQSGGCPPENGACALGNAVYADTYFHAHEQAHDYVYRAWSGWSSRLLDEGEAVALSCNPFYELEPGQKPTDRVGPLDWRDLLNLFGDSNEGYGAAGFFVTFLAGRYGWPSVAALHQRVALGAAAGDLERAFADVFPTTIDEAWSEALGTAGAAPCQRDWVCLATPMTVGETATPDCDAEMHRSVDVTAAGGVVLSLDGADARLMLLRCDVPAPTSYTLELGRVGHATTHWASLPAGSYAMFGGPLPSIVTLQSAFAGPLVGDTCDSASAVSLDAGGTTYVDLPAGSVNGWMRLAGGGRSYDVSPYDLLWNDLLTAQAITICDDCSAAACVNLPFGAVTRVLIGDQSVMRLQNVVASPSSSTAWGQLIFDVAAAP